MPLDTLDVDCDIETSLARFEQIANTAVVTLPELRDRAADILRDDVFDLGSSANIQDASFSPSCAISRHWRRATECRAGNCAKPFSDDAKPTRHFRRHSAGPQAVRFCRTAGPLRQAPQSRLWKLKNPLMIDVADNSAWKLRKTVFQAYGHIMLPWRVYRATDCLRLWIVALFFTAHRH